MNLKEALENLELVLFDGSDIIQRLNSESTNMLGIQVAVDCPFCSLGQCSTHSTPSELNSIRYVHLLFQTKWQLQTVCSWMTGASSQKKHYFHLGSATGWSILWILVSFTAKNSWQQFSAVYGVPVIYPEVRGTPNLQKHNLPALVWLLDSIIKITQLGKAQSACACSFSLQHKRSPNFQNHNLAAPKSSGFHPTEQGAHFACLSSL